MHYAQYLRPTHITHPFTAFYRKWSNKPTESAFAADQKLMVAYECEQYASLHTYSAHKLIPNV